MAKRTENKTANRTAIEAVKEAPRRRSIVPVADQELRDVAMKAAAVWKASGLTLHWITPEQFEQTAVDFAVLIDERMSLGANRRPLTDELNLLDKEINTHTANVKGYIADLYGRERGQGYYAEFGIVRVGKTYQLPIDRNDRLSALERLTQAIVKHGIGGQRYGSEYWKDITARYNALMYQAGSTDSAVSARVRDKNELKATIKLVLHSLVLLVQANYPDDWRSLLRQWGFQKEKY